MAGGGLAEHGSTGQLALLSHAGGVGPSSKGPISNSLLIGSTTSGGGGGAPELSGSLI